MKGKPDQLLVIVEAILKVLVWSGSLDDVIEDVYGGDKPEPDGSIKLEVALLSGATYTITVAKQS